MKLSVTELDAQAHAAIKASGGVAMLYPDGRAALLNSERELSRYRVERLLKHQLRELGCDGLLEGFHQTIIAKEGA